MVATPYRIAVEDRANPTDWLLKLSDQELREWLRTNVRGQRTGPVYEAQGIDFETRLADLADHSQDLLDRLRSAVASLLAEWRRPDAAEALESLIVLYQRLRASVADISMRRIFSTELRTDNDTERSLRRRILTALVAVESPNVDRLFWDGLADSGTATICFRGLYERDLKNVAKALPRLLRTMQSPDDDEALQRVLWRMIYKRLHQEQLAAFLPMALRNVTATELIRLTHLLERINLRIDLEMGLALDTHLPQRAVARLNRLAHRLSAALSVEQIRDLDQLVVPGYFGPATLAPTMGEMRRRVKDIAHASP